MDNGKIGETYILTSAKSIGFTETGKVIARVLGKRIWIIPIPAKFMIFAASVEEKVFLKLGKRPIVTRKNIEATVTDRVYDIGKARKEIGYNPSMGMVHGIKRTVSWYKKEGLI